MSGDREGPRPGRPAPGSTPLPTSPLPGGRRPHRPADPRMADNRPVHTPSRSSLLPAASSDSSPLQGGGREGGPAPGSAGVPPASREARTRMRALGPPCRRDAGAPRRFTDERDREDPRPGRRASGSPPPTRPPPFQGGGDRIGRPIPAWRTTGPFIRLPGLHSSPLPALTPPPFRGEVGRGVPPLGAPASRRHRAKRERGCGPSARHAGGTPALPGGSRMSGIGKVPVRVAEPGQPPSRPPPFQGGGEKTQGRRGEDGAARLPVRPSRAFPNGALTPPPFQGGEVKADSRVRSPWNVPAQGLRGGP